MTEKLEASKRLIHEWMERAKSATILWSGGKDSQFLLALLRNLGYDVPVIHFRSLPHPTKHRFADEQIERMGLRLLAVPPVGVDIVANGAEINLLDVFAFRDGLSMCLPMENEPGRPADEHSACAVKVINQKFAQIREGVGYPSPSPDVIFIGHRADDGDPVFGDLPVKDYVATKDGVTAVYPLRDWSAADVWEASRLLEVSQNEARYIGGDMSANADYFPLCTECYKPGLGAVLCPKIGDYVYNLGNHLNLEQRREGWRQTFINIEGKLNGNVSQNQTP